MRGAIPPLPLYVFMAWCLVKQRGNFTFTLPFTPCMYVEIIKTKADIKLTLHKALIKSIMTYACTACEFAVEI
jgi:hypothetical protein